MKFYFYSLKQMNKPYLLRKDTYFLSLILGNSSISFTEASFFPPSKLHFTIFVSFTFYKWTRPKNNLIKRKKNSPNLPQIAGDES